MNKEELGKKLVELGYFTNNYYPKKSFASKSLADICVGLYKKELGEDFYFSNSYDGKIYKLPKPMSIDLYTKEDFMGNVKYLVPLTHCTVIWEDKEFEELPDLPYNNLTMRQYACIHLKIPQSGISWLDRLIEESKKDTI